ncbi:MAG: hypothetical protein PVG83_06375 [Acidimicrobiia bacterium]
MPDASPHIGTLREKPLHASLKRWYSHPSDRVECPVEGFVVDLVRGDLLIEIQTRGFASMKQKTRSLLDLGHRLRIAYPVPVDKWIIKVNEDGSILSRRRSPKHGETTDVFSELVTFPELLAHPNLEVDVLLTVEEEYRTHMPGQAWRRKGWVVVERHLVEVLGSVLLTSVEDAAALLPDGMPDPFTTSDLASSLGRPRRLAQQMAYCLRKAGGIHDVGKRGNALLYRSKPQTDGKTA